MAIDEFTNTGVMRNVFTSSPDKSLGYLLTRVYGLRQKKMNEELAPLGLNYVQYNLLAGLYWLQMNGETVNQMTLINFTKLDKSVVSSILRKFTNDAYVSRVEGTEDTRAKIVTLTAKGKGLTEKAIKIINYIDEKFWGDTSQEPVLQFLCNVINVNT